MAIHQESVQFGKAKHESVDEEFDLDSILEALKEEEEVEEGEDKEVDEVAELRAELDETREVVKFMRDKLNEVNLLNASSFCLLTTFPYLWLEQ